MFRKVYVDEFLFLINIFFRVLMVKLNKKKMEDFFLVFRSFLCIDFYYKMMMLLFNLVG